MKKNLIFLAIALLGAWALGVLALHQGERINAVWMVTAAVCIYVIGYQFYGRFVARKVLGLDSKRATPALVQNDGLDFVPTNKHVLFGHHFAAIAGAGPLVGPIIAAQMGYLPGMLWLLIGVVFAGAVHDFTVLFLSTRRGGKSIGEMIKLELGQFTGSVAMIGIFFIMLIIVGILAMVVVNALADSPWGLFTIAMTIPIAIFMGIYMRFLRPGSVIEASIIGFALLMIALYLGRSISVDPELSQLFSFTKVQLAIFIMIYGFIAAILPVWFLLAPRDYLSTFLKIGVIVLMAVSIMLAAPDLKMPKLTSFTDGTGPVTPGALFPFLFITIACGAISGFHAIISSGTSPKMIANEEHALYVGYGAMLMESMVGIMALIAACIIEPGLYFAINVPASFLGTTAVSASEYINSIGFMVSPEDIKLLASQIGEANILSRTGGAPTFAIGLTLIMHELFANEAFMAFWYHFAILFEALFILTAVDAGTRAGRFMVQDILGNVHASFGNTKSHVYGPLATLICVSGWGYLLYAGVTDPMGGIFTLWPLFGASNQMLAGMALLLATVVLFKAKKERFAWVFIVPLTFVLITTLSAAFAKLMPANGDRVHDAVSHVAAVQIWTKKLETLSDPVAISKAEAVIRNNTIDAILCAFFILVTFTVLIQTLRICFGLKGITREKLFPLRESEYKNAKDYQALY